MIYPLILALLVTLCIARPTKNQQPSYLPSELRKMNVLPIGSKLENLDLSDPSSFHDVTPEHITEMQLSDKDNESMKWITNGTHVLSFAPFTVHANMTITTYGLAVSRVHLDFQDSKAKFQGTSAGASLGFGVNANCRCYFKEDLETIAQENWSATYKSFSFAEVIGMATIDFTGRHGEDIGSCMALAGGIQIISKDYGIGRFYLSDV